MNATVGQMLKQDAIEKGTFVEADHGISYTIHTNCRDQIVCTIWKGKSNKPCYNYAVRSEAQAMDAINERITWAKDAAADKVRRAAEKKASAREMAHDIVVGTLLSYSWGYEQTNVEFFQVVEKKGVTVTLRQIKGTMVEATGSMSANFRACPDSFCGESFKKRIGAYGVSMDHGTARPTSSEAEHYCSWYA